MNFTVRNKDIIEIRQMISLTLLLPRPPNHRHRHFRLDRQGRQRRAHGQSPSLHQVFQLLFEHSGLLRHFHSLTVRRRQEKRALREGSTAVRPKQKSLVEMKHCQRAARYDLSQEQQANEPLYQRQLWKLLLEPEEMPTIPLQHLRP